VKRSIYFDRFRFSDWPAPSELEPFFLAPGGQEWSYDGGNDSWGLSAEGLFGTEGRDRRDQVTVRLGMIGHPEHGVYLYYGKWDGRIQQKYSYNSKGDLKRLREFAKSLHGDRLSIGLFIPFAAAWQGVKEFIETDGELPASITWIASDDLPADAFPIP